MDVQRKVTAFITRGSGEGAGLLVHRHASAGVQLPAGTVEEGETFEAAAVREAAEETALEGLILVRRLGARTYDFPEGRAVLRRPAFLRAAPRLDAHETRWSLDRVVVDVIARETGFARVVYQETDLDSNSGLVLARFEGWVPGELLLHRQEREFYHFRVDGPTPERWQTIENGVYEFHLSWVALVPRPTLLVPAQQAWLDDFHAVLLADVGVPEGAP